MTRHLILSAPLLLLTAAAPAYAELVFFQSGRAMSVRAIRSENDGIVLQLRAGGDVHCDQSLIVRVEPDEVEYPEEVAEASSVIREPDAPPIPEAFRQLVTATAAKHGVDARVVNALIQVESAYHSRAVSPKGARGLMQVMPTTGRQYGALDLFDPKVNVDAGVRHLKKLLSRYDLPLALAAYNAGEAAVDRFGGIPPFRETQNYVTRILRILGRS
ncbi:MAG TPA: lytic transglycosylase domain-containing protein [Vicinamibacterales bacterium]|nr:lytic transglycosylase domain-containing protein [Vicinamibacterales bacterium]